MKNIISNKNLKFVKEAIVETSKKMLIYNSQKVVWICFGSFVINNQDRDSDLDLMCVGDIFDAPNRSIIEYKKRMIHTCIVPSKEYIKDGKKRLYGAYFTGKVINPHILLYGNRKLRHTVMKHAGAYIGDLAGYIGSLVKSKTHTKSQITAQVFIAYLSTDPSFDSYLLRYFVAPNFQKLWVELCKDTVKILKYAKVIANSDSKFKYLKRLKYYKEFHEERMKSSERHKNFGAICNNNDYTFQDLIYRNAKKKMKMLDPDGTKYKKMVLFLKKESGLRDIYIYIYIYISNMINTKPYRLGVNALIIDDNYNFLIIQKSEYKDNEWTIVGGGCEDGETLLENAFREVQEEIGIGKEELEFIKQSKYGIEYDYPVELAKKIYNGKYRGQSYAQIFVRFRGNKNKLRFNDEIRTHKWVKAQDLKKYLIFPNQYESVKRAIQDVLPKISLE